MSDLYWPPTLIPFESNVAVQDSLERHTANVTGFTQTVGRPGSRLQMSMAFRNLATDKRRLLKTIIAATRGGTRALYVPDHSYDQSDYHSVSDLAPSIDFENGSTGYTLNTSNVSGTVYDRAMRITRIRNAGGSNLMLRFTNAATVTPYQAYVGRAIVHPGSGDHDEFRIGYGSTAFGTEYLSVSSLEPGLIASAFVPYASSLHFAIGQGANESLANDYFDVPFISLAPCALVDNGPNLFLQSADPSTASWTKTRASIASTSVTLPDGTTGTVNTLKEDSTAGDNHFFDQAITVSSSAQDICIAIALKAANRSWARLTMVESSTIAGVYINLADGTLSSIANGASWSDGRAYVVSLGNGWYYLALVARKTSSGTTVTGRIYIAEGTGDVTFDGGNQDSLYIWRPSIGLASTPIRLSATTTAAASSGTDQALGGGVYIRGMTAYASTNEVLKRGALVNVNGQTQILESPLNIDASGRGFLHVPSLRSAPPDATPVIFVNPLLRMIPMEPENGWGNTLERFMNAEVSLGEAA